MPVLPLNGSGCKMKMLSTGWMEAETRHGDCTGTRNRIINRLCLKRKKSDRSKIWFGWKYLIIFASSFLVLLVFLFFLLQLFHQLAFTVAVHHRSCLVLAVFSEGGRIAVIACNYQLPAEVLSKKRNNNQRSQQFFQCGSVVEIVRQRYFIKVKKWLQKWEIRNEK